MIHLLLAVIYAAFISLGLPDSLLGAAWPSMYQGFGVPVSYSGIIFCIVSGGTVISSLLSDRLTRRLGAGRVTAISVAMTALALFGFSISGQFWMLCLWAVPYGLGAGSVDAALNNYVALHFSSRHMSWLHCMWGVGASVGPYIMGAALSGGAGWPMGYRIISLIQLVLTCLIFLSLPLWKTGAGEDAQEEKGGEVLGLGKILGLPGAKEILIAFFCYCALEQTTGLWASSYLVLHKGVAPETAAGFASLFYIGITLGRAVCGILAAKWTDPDDSHGAGHHCPGPCSPAAAGGGERRSGGTDFHRPGLCPHLPQRHPFHPGPLRRGQVPGRYRRGDGQCLHRQLPHAPAVWLARREDHHGPVSLLSAGRTGPDGRHA